jgi:DNA-binding MarR family transcriptional regulator/GNAT superfamily N-acetyltransferase
MSLETLTDRVKVVRGFNRFYTRQIGVLHEHLLNSDFSLTEARILFELAIRTTVTTSDLSRELNLDAGYLSRVIAGFEKKGLVSKVRLKTDARAAHLELTKKGRTTFRHLDEASGNQVTEMLTRMSEPEQDGLIASMSQIQSALGERTPDYLLRDPQPGDMGWIVHRQAVLYAQEYGWNSEYEALVAEIVAKFIREFDPKSERCWIAEKNGRVVGSVFVVRQNKTTAKLRLLYVDPMARGLGIGRRLVEECLRFARFAGYKKMTLWTNSVLTAARSIYDKAGFRLVKEEPHHSFGKDLTGQIFELEL